jgi:AcrR family transcriptional regulator
VDGVGEEDLGARDRQAREGAPRRPPPRERILEAAANLFYRNGVRAVGVDAIIAAARVAKASFYRHFHSKEDLVVDWLRSDRARWLDGVRAETERRARAPDELLPVFFDVLSEHVASAGFAGCPYLNTALELREPDGPVRAVVIGFLMELEAYLGTLAAAAGLRSHEQLATELRVLCGGCMTAAAALDQPATASEAARGTVRGMLGTSR